MFFTHIDDQWQFLTPTTTVLLLPRWMARIKYKQAINLTREIKGNNLDLTKGGREKGENWHIPIETQSPNTGTHKEGEEGELLFIVVPYPIRYFPYAVPINRQQLHQQQSQLRKKRNVLWHYYHLNGHGGQYIIHRIEPNIQYLSWHHHELSVDYHPCTKSSLPTRHHHIKQSTLSPNCTYMFRIIV